MAFPFKPAFGTAATTTASSGGLFGSTATSAAPGLAFGFGSTATATPAFGATTTAASATGGFGGANFGFGAVASSAAPAFGTATVSSAAPSFGGFGTSTATGPTFGAAAVTSATPAFGFGTSSAAAPLFGTTTSAAPSFGGFNFSSASTGASGFGAGSSLLAAARTAPTPAAVAANVHAAVSMPLIFGDERDAVIAKWNQLQAFWGTGRGYFNQQGQFIDFAPDNPFSVFKAVGYNVLPSTRNEEGLVAVTIDKKMSDVCDNQQTVVDTLQRLVVGNQPNATICVDGIRPLLDDRTEVIVYVQQRANTGVTSRVSASDLYTHMCSLKQQLQTQLAVSMILPKTGMTPEQKKLYLDNPPAGIDARIWDQAKLDNPDAERMIPVPMVGFTELHNRLKHQDQQTTLHQARLDLIANDIATLQRNQADVVAKTEQYKRNQLVLGHRILKVLVKQELYRKHGYAIQADEEHLRVKLETIFAELSAPMQFKGRLNELMSQMRMQNQLGVSVRSEVGYQIEPTVQQEIKQHLKRQQEGLSHLIGIIKTDLVELGIIEQGLAESSKLKH